MKRLIWLIICLPIALTTTIYGQTKTTPQAGLSLATYQLPTTKTGFTNFSTSNYYQPVFGEQKNVPKLVLNKQQVKRDKALSFIVNTLFLLNGTNQGPNLGSIGLPSPAFNPLVSDLSGPNDYLLLQQHEFQRNKLLPTLIAAPQALQLRF